MPGRPVRAGRPPLCVWPLLALLQAAPPGALADTTAAVPAPERAAAAAAGLRELRYLGHAVARADGRYLYTEVHRHRYDGWRWLGGSIRYVAPDGRALGEKTLDFGADPYVPVMRYRLAGGVHEERITRVDAQALVLSRRRDGRDERRVIARVPEQAADAGFSAWIADRLASLADGRGATLQFVVVGRLDQYRFRISPAGRLTLAGEPALRLRVQPDSLLRLLADPLELVYGLESRRLLRYQGPSNLPDPVTGEVPDVVISYDEAPPGAPARLPVP